MKNTKRKLGSWQCGEAANKKRQQAPAKAPIEARTFSQICKLPRDNLSTGDFWISIDEEIISIHEQPLGEELHQHIEIDRRAFDRFVRWYMTGNPNKPTRKRT